MSGTTTNPAPSTMASGGTGVAIAVVVNQYCSWRSITVQPDFPLAVATLAAAGVHMVQMAFLAVTNRIAQAKKT